MVATQAANAQARAAHPDPIPVDPALVRAWLDKGEAVLIDVRKDFEHAEARIEGAALKPLPGLEADVLRRAADGRRLVFHCKSGKRSAQAAECCADGTVPVFYLAGGLDAWEAAGLPVLRPATAPRLPVMRQVQITAGALVAIGTALGATVSPWFLAIPAFVGCGLMFAGLSGWCGLASLLAAMPWNRRKTAQPSCAA